jgi:predicted Zn-dependent peptidase
VLFGPRFLHVDDSESQTTLDLMFQGVPEPHPLYGAQSLLLRVLDDGLSTRLHRRVVDELGLAYGVSASPEVLEDTVLVDIVTSSAHSSTASLLEAILQLTSELREAPPEAAELEMAKRRLIWDVQASLDGPRAMTEVFGASALLGQQLSLSERVNRVLAAKPEEVLEAARLLFGAGRVAVAAVGRLKRSGRAALARLLEA